jgi:hypothetical protein
MKDQYVVGIPRADFINIMGYDPYSVICTMDEESAKSRKELMKRKNLKMYKLVEVE